MTWSEYLDLEMSRGCSYDNAQNVIGHLMDIYEDYDWDNEIPFDPDK